MQPATQKRIAPNIGKADTRPMDLMRYAAQLSQAELSKPGGKGLPPVDKWDPPYCGELDLTIRSDGVWVHEGTPIGRARLVRLFSTVLRRDGDQYFLVTPVEKLGIVVEDAPFQAVLMEMSVDASAPDNQPNGGGQLLTFTTNVGDVVTAGSANALVYRPPIRSQAQTDTATGDARGGEIGTPAPYLHVRRGLEAKVSRAVFYDLVALGETREINGVEQFGVASDGAFFPFGPASDVLGETPDGD